MIFAVGQNTLGYANKSIDNGIKKVIKNGNMTTLNCPEEVQLAEKLIQLGYDSVINNISKIKALL